MLTQPGPLFGVGSRALTGCSDLVGAAGPYAAQ